MDIHLFSRFLCILVLSELLFNGRKVFIGNLGVGILVNIKSLFVQEFNKVTQTDVELLYKFVESYFCH